MRTLLTGLFFISVSGSAQQQIDRNYFERLLAQKQFKKVFLKCDSLLDESYGKASHFTYYYMGKSLCGEGYTDQGKEWYKYIKDKLPIDKDFRKEVTKAETTCMQNVPDPAPTVININVVVNTSYTPAGAGGVGGVHDKIGFSLGCEKDANENYQNLRRNDSLNERVFDLTQKKEAVNKLRSFLPPNYNIDTSGRFIVVSSSNSSYFREDVLKVTSKLEFAYQFYITKYKLKPIEKLFTVYLTPGKYEFRKVAKDVHDIVISEANIGYSSLNDLSLLGIADPNSVGTLFHELFHLVIRSDIGDISPWLDEGMASLYSVYRVANNELAGSYSTWRVKHFRLLVNLKSSEKVTVPTLEQLINYNWQDFQGGPSENLCIASVHYALANFYVLFLQELNLLANTVDAIKNRRKLGKDSLLPGPSDTKLIEMVFKSSIDSISKKFYNWLMTRYNINMPALLVRRPTYFASDLPPNFQPTFNTIDTLISELEKKPNLISKSELKEIKDKKKILLSSIASYQRDYVRHQNEILQRMVRSDSNSGGNWDYSDESYERFTKQKEIELTAFITRLNTLLGNNSGCP